MNLDLEKTLKKQQVEFQVLDKKTKVKILSEWAKGFPELVRSDKELDSVNNMMTGAEVENVYFQKQAFNFFVLPDDASAMPAYECQAKAMPDLKELVSDAITKCEKIIIVDGLYQWSLVLVNHGSARNVGMTFSSKPSSN